jgi:acyl-CoA hydrolase
MSTPTIMSEVVFSDQTNHYGTLFGGHALRMMDMAAFVAATRYARKTVVTVSAERVDFRGPVAHGELAELEAKVLSTGRTSLTVEVTLTAEVLLTGERRACARGVFVFVALDEDRRPTAVHP